MKKHSRIEIKSAEGTMTELYIDGHLIRGVRSIKFKKRARKFPILTVDLNALDIAIDSPAAVRQKGYGDMNITFEDGCKVFEQ